MEIILNIAWALCSISLVLLWVRGARSSSDADPVSRRTQLLALAMVVMLLLPVISLSDDLMAMQGPAETDTCLRKALHTSDFHPAFASSSWALPAPMLSELSRSGYSRLAPESYLLVPRPARLPNSLDSRPPPQA